MSGARVDWNDDNFKKSCRAKALDGIEEVVRGDMLTQAKEDCPVAPINGGTMRNSLGTERDDKKGIVYMGGGGAAKAYIKRQERDRTLNHTSGKAGFLVDSMQMHIGKVKPAVEKHLNR